MYIALEKVRSLYNVGSVMRTMSFFGLKNLILVGYSGRKKPGLDELHEKVNKTSLGAEEDVNIIFLNDSEKLIKYCKNKDLKLVVIEQDKKSVSLRGFKASKKMVMVLGNEVDGVSQKLLKKADKIVEIPRLGSKKSLNVATTAGIVIETLTS
jgi:tRNA G18 (ribose-2'-O)-methylase SpoU